MFRISNKPPPEWKPRRTNQSGGRGEAIGSMPSDPSTFYEGCDSNFARQPTLFKPLVSLRSAAYPPIFIPRSQVFTETIKRAGKLPCLARGDDALGMRWRLTTRSATSSAAEEPDHRILVDYLEILKRAPPAANLKRMLSDRTNSCVKLVMLVILIILERQRRIRRLTFIIATQRMA